MAGSLKVSLVVLAGMVFTLSACHQISDRSMATPTVTTPSSPQSKPAAAKYSTATNQKQSQDKPAATESQRGDYKPVSLAEINKASTSSDPQEVALSVFGNTDSEGGSREVIVEYPQPDQAIVTITQTGVADDSVAAIRYRVDLVQTNSAPAAKSWKIVWAGSQFKCQQGRGHQDWSTKLCS